MPDSDRAREHGAGVTDGLHLVECPEQNRAVGRLLVHERLWSVGIQDDAVCFALWVLSVELRADHVVDLIPVGCGHSNILLLLDGSSSSLGEELRCSPFCLRGLAARADRQQDTRQRGLSDLLSSDSCDYRTSPS